MAKPPKASSSCPPIIPNNICFGLSKFACLCSQEQPKSVQTCPPLNAPSKLFVVSHRVARLVSNVHVRSSPAKPCAILSTHPTHRLLRSRLPGTCALPRRAPLNSPSNLDRLSSSLLEVDGVLLRLAMVQSLVAAVAILARPARSRRDARFAQARTAL
jgi:hypothetical protein